MKLDPCRCPECGQLAEGIVEDLRGLAQLDVCEDGHADYAGYTEV